MSRLCQKKFNLWMLENKGYFEIYKKIGSPVPFDVSLRDGIQSMKTQITTTDKKQIYSTITKLHNPPSIEVGSLVSPKVLPVFADSIEFYNYCVANSKKINNYILIPNSDKLINAINIPCYNLSFISSVSNSFQLKNTKKNLEDTKKDILNMMYTLDDNFKMMNPNIKLYLSCINQCPFEGKIDKQKIIDEIKWYYENVKPTILCLSDTCGTLNNNDYLEIIDNCNIPYTTFGIHLHFDEQNEEEAIKILKSSFERKIKNIDVSFVENGGCSVTIKNPKKNLTYDLYYKTLQEYIIEKSK